MRREHRLRSSKEVQQVVADGGRVVCPQFVLYHVRREQCAPVRVGFAVGRRVGGAVTRNRVRRVMREAVRGLIPRLVACDLVVVARPPAVGAGVRDLERAFAEAVARAGLLETTS